MIVLDTNIISALFGERPEPRIVAWARRIGSAELATTAITEAEIRFGLAAMPLGRRRTALLQALDIVLDRQLLGRVLPFDRAATPYFADFVASRNAEGRPVQVPDAMIAATARAYGAKTIVTRDVKDFEGCGIALLNPFET